VWVFGFFAKSLNSITLWITSSLYGGYAAANVLKWIWWRFNGYVILGNDGRTDLFNRKTDLLPGNNRYILLPCNLAVSMIASMQAVY
jgi:hypothetical protein